MADQIPVRIYTFQVEIWGPPPFAYDSPEEFDAANQTMVDNMDHGVTKYNIDRNLPAGYFTKIEK